MQNDEKYNYDSEWIHRLEAEDHWRSYWHQQKLMEGFIDKVDRVLEIGVGSGFAANYLKSKNISVTTIDIDNSKNPDIVANIVQYNLPKTYDHILAFEVFEHIPYNEFEYVLEKLNKHTNKYIFLSVPYNEKVWLNVELYLHVFGSFKLSIRTRRNKLTTKNHFWEIKYRNHSKKSIEKTFQKFNFNVKREFRFKTQQFYCLEKNNA